ncbi:MAG: ABC transporter ATP-binding protein, partial [Nitrososphaerota archaeon]
MIRNTSLLTVKDLRVYYKSILGDYKAVDGVSFTVNPREVFGIAGESGCGKSTLVEGILKLVKPPGYIKSGQVVYKGKDLLSIEDEELRKLRWREFALIPQGSMNSLNPVLTVEEQMIDAVIEHSNYDKKEARKLAVEALQSVGLPIATLKMYPHELSGGMKQRAIIAMSTLLKPSLVVADEPVTALDVVVQKGVLQAIARLREAYNITVIFVSHDMAAHAQIVDRLAVMYAGKIVEMGDVNDVFLDPLHPYSKLLISSIPSLEKKDIKGI